MLELSDNEKRDMIRFIEAGKPLPDEYRFKLFGDKREVELVWSGKTNEVTNVVLPFQTIEQIDEPRSEVDLSRKQPLFDFSGKQISDWTNKLIWGDNKLILSSLKNGPLREEIEKQGGIKLIYIDPPFDVGADFSMDVEIGDETYHKEPSVLEELAYRDTWGKGADSFIAMIYERLWLMKDLLADDGSIYVHCDWRVSGFMRLALDEIFGPGNFLNEIIWSYEGTGSPSSTKLASKHDTIYRYAKKRDSVSTYKMYFEQEIDKSYSSLFQDDQGFYRIQGLGDYSEESIKKFDQEGRIYHSSKGTRYLKHYFTEKEGKLVKDKKLSDVWNDITQLGTSVQKEKVDYPTQKPEKLLARMIEIDSKKGDLVADFFIGSGTTLAVSEKLGRKWIGSDLGKFSIHTARKRMIGVQRELKKVGKDFRAFEILNLGKYERQYYTYNFETKGQEYVKLILQAYKAQPDPSFKTMQGTRSNRLVAIGPVNLPASREFITEVIEECRNGGFTKVDVLAFEFEMGLFPEIQDEAKKKGVDLALKYIPRDVFDKRAIEKNQVSFFDVSYVDVKPHVKKNSIAIELLEFASFYSQETVAEVESLLKNGSSKIMVEAGQIVKVSKDADGITTKELLTKKWTDWIDYWSVDLNYESKKELHTIVNADGEEEQVWTGNYIFENDWQSFRTKKDRKLELQTPFIEVTPGARKIAVKVIDIFGNDTMKVIEVRI